MKKKKKINENNYHLPSQKNGIVVNISDEVIYCIGLPNVKFGEIVTITLNNKIYEGIVINIS